MSYVLRDYQQKASDAAVSFFNNKAKKTNAIMVLPTGSGKSLIIADIASRLDGHTLVFQPSKEKEKADLKSLQLYILCVLDWGRCETLSFLFFDFECKGGTTIRTYKRISRLLYFIW